MASRIGNRTKRTVRNRAKAKRIALKRHRIRRRRATRR